jgi:Uma2 family endonuclease
LVTSTKKLVTAEELLAMPDQPRYELVYGELVEKPVPGELHGYVQANILALLGAWAKRSHAGRAYAEVGFVLNRDPDVTYLPDVAFRRASRDQAAARGFVEGSPELAVEVLSPTNTRGEMRRKVSEYLEAGTTQVWVVDPDQGLVTIYERGKVPVDISGDAELDGGELLPGFRCRVSEFFE